MSNGILLDKGLVDSFYDAVSHGFGRYESTTRTEAVTSAVKVSWPQIKVLSARQIPYYVTPKGAPTFAYSNQSVRTALENLGTVADLGGLINACIASQLGLNCEYRYARVYNANELIEVLKLVPTIQRIAKNIGQPVDTREIGLE